MTAMEVSRRAESRIAITVMDSASGLALCPFFGRCDGILLLVADTETTEFLRNPPRTADSLCELLLTTRPDGLVCGFIGEPEKQKLQAAGIDVRIGSCACPPRQLAATFRDLPHA